MNVKLGLWEFTKSTIKLRKLPFSPGEVNSLISALFQPKSVTADNFGLLKNKVGDIAYFCHLQKIA